MPQRARIGRVEQHLRKSLRAVAAPFRLLAELLAGETAGTLIDSVTAPCPEPGGRFMAPSS